MAVELRNTIGRMIGRSLPATLLFDYPTIDGLADYLCKEILQIDMAHEPSPTSEPSNSNQTVEKLKQMSDEEVEAMLVRKLHAWQGGHPS